MSKTIAISPQTEILLIYKPREDLSFLKIREKNGRKVLILEEKKEELSLAKKWGEGFSNAEYFSLENATEVLKKILWRFLLQKKELVTFGEKTSRFFQLKNQLEELSQGVELVASELGDMGKSLCQNVIQNFAELSSYVLRQDLKNAFEKEPAIILGAGASLVKEKLTEDILLFAAGTAIEALSSFPIQPHFAASIDKDAPAKVFQEDFLKNTTFFFQLRSNPKIVKKPFFQKILCPDHHFYPLQNLFYQTLGTFEEMDSGWNVATFLLQQAIFLGCSPIYLIGMDFCFTEKAYYAHKKGHAEKEAWIETKNQKGEKVFTKKDFLQAKSWLEVLSKKYPGRIFNLSERGLAIEGAPFVEKVKTSSIKDPKCKIKALAKKRNLSLQTKIEILQALEKSFYQCQKNTERTLSFFEKNFAKLVTKKQFFSRFLQAPFEKEVAYTHYLHFFWEIFRPTLMQKTTDQAPLFLQEWLQKLLFFQENSSFFQKELSKKIKKLELLR